MKKKITIFFGVLGLFAFSVINYWIPIKANTIESNLELRNNEYYIIAPSTYDISNTNSYTAFQMHFDYIQYNQNDYENIQLQIKIIKSDNNYYLYEELLDDELVQIDEPTEYELDEPLSNYLIFIYNYYNQEQTYNIFFYGVFKVGMGDLCGPLVFSKYFFTLANDNNYFNLTTRQYLFNDFYYGGTINGLFQEVNNFFEYSAFYKYALIKYNEGVAANISTNWFTNIFNGISRFLAIQVFPGFQIGYLLAIPIVFGILRMILHIWKN